MSVASTAVPALLFNALVWGLSWWPLRQLEARGLHPLWTTAGIFMLCIVVITLARPRALPHLWRTPRLWVLMLASGATNATFNWGVVVGDVVRVVLLFYLMPLWALLFARVLLGEHLTRLAGVRVVIALAGAACVLWPSGAAAGSVLQIGLADLLGLAGGVCFALNNVMLRRLASEPEDARALGMFIGGALVSALLAIGLQALGTGGVTPPQLAEAGAVPGLLVLAVVVLASNLALQYGAARLPASVTAVVMLTEIVFASGSAVLLGGGTVTPMAWLGGLLILSASALSVLESSRPAPVRTAG